MSKLFLSSDDALVAALRKGDNQALKFVYKTYWPMISRFVRENSGSEEDAEELYQEGIIALYEKFKSPDFILSCSIKTYIYSICRNKWLNVLKGRRVIVDLEEYLEVSDLPEENLATVLPEDVEMIEVISSMGDPCHSLLVGFYYHQLSLDNLAEKLQYASANVAKQQKFRCIERLKKIFGHKEFKFAND